MEMNDETVEKGIRLQLMFLAVVFPLLFFLGSAASAAANISLSVPDVIHQGEDVPLELGLGSLASQGKVPVAITVRLFPDSGPSRQPKARYHAKKEIAAPPDGHAHMVIPGSAFSRPGRYLITAVSDTVPEVVGHVEFRVKGSTGSEEVSKQPDTAIPPVSEINTQAFSPATDSKIDALIAKGRANSDQKNYDQAVSLFNQALALQPNHVKALYERGRAQYKDQRKEKAFANFNRALEIDAGYEDALYYRSVCYTDQGAHDLAIADASHAIRVNPTSSWNYIARGNAYFQWGLATKNDGTAKRKYYKAAIDDFTRAIQYKHKELEAAYNNRGVAYRHLGQCQKAIADYTRAIEIKDSVAHHYANRAYCYCEIKAFQKSLADYNRALSIDPQRIGDYAERGLVYRQLKHYDTAIADLTWAIEHNITKSWVYANRGACYLAKKDFQAAIRDCSVAIEKNGRYEWAIANRGQAYLNSGNPKLALADFERAAALNPNDAWNLAHRGEAHRKLGNRKAAVRDFKQALKRDPGYAWAKNRLETIKKR